MITPNTQSTLRQGHLDLRGSRLYYRVAGRGPALLLLHGWALDGDLWTPQWKTLTRHHRVVVVDRRGFGRSTGRPSIEREVQDLRVLCRRLGITRVGVVGMSQATRVALRLASSRSLRVDRLVLDGPPEPPRDAMNAGSEDPPMTRYRALVAESGMAAFRNRWSRHPLLRLHRAGRRSRDLLARMSRRYPGKDLRPGSQAVVPAKKVVPERIRQPVLLLCGSEDLAHRLDAATTLCRQLPDAVLRQVPGAGHLPNLDRPRAYVQALESFFRRRKS